MRLIFTALAGSGLALTLAGPAAAQGSFDGAWAVDVNVSRGNCGDEGRSFPVRVSGGRIAYAGNLDLDATGSIAPDGRITARFSRGSDSLSARGRASGSSASGTWTSPSRNCSGTFRARRSG